MGRGAAPAFNKDAISMYLVKATAYKTPVTITPKKKRRGGSVDTVDGEEHQEGGNSSDDDISKLELDATPPRMRRGKKPHTTKVAMPLRRGEKQRRDRH